MAASSRRIAITLNPSWICSPLRTYSPRRIVPRRLGCQSILASFAPSEGIYNNKQSICRSFSRHSRHNHHQQHGHRHTNDHNHHNTIRTIREAFDTLGIPPHSPWEEIRRAFVQLALQYHPDQSGGGSSSSSQHFVRIREAFEVLRDDLFAKTTTSGDPKATNRYKGPSGWSKEELQAWYQRETGEFLSFEMSERTRAEVIHVYKTMAQGGRDRGGYWDMARQLAERDQWQPNDRSKTEPHKQITGSTTATHSLTHRRKRR